MKYKTYPIIHPFSGQHRHFCFCTFIYNYYELFSLIFRIPMYSSYVSKC
ncbi:hypothetical protein X975_05856, partial [Stegodyphus mimosarum]